MYSNGINMYFIEKIIKIYKRMIKKEQPEWVGSEDNNYELEDILTCNHIFMPIDSTKNIYACTKCGYVITKSRLEKEKNRHKK